MLVSTAKSPAQPDAAQYPVSAIELYDRYTRQSFREKFGQQAPPADPSKPTKAWFGTDQRGDPVTYAAVIDGAVKAVSIPAADFGAVNLAGEYEYPEWVPPAGYAHIKFHSPVGSVQEWDQGGLVRESEVSALALSLGVPYALYNPGPEWEITYSKESEGRLFILKFNGGWQSAFLLMQQWTRNGMGCPGKWVGLDSAIPTWQKTPPAQPAAGEVPCPIRPLLGNETPFTNTFGASLIKRTDKSVTSPVDGSFKDSDRQAAQDTQMDVHALGAKVDVLNAKLDKVIAGLSIFGIK